MRHRRPDTEKATMCLKAWASHLRPQSPADLYNELLRGVASKLGASITAVLIVWAQNRF